MPDRCKRRVGEPQARDSKRNIEQGQGGGKYAVETVAVKPFQCCCLDTLVKERAVEVVAPRPRRKHQPAQNEGPGASVPETQQTEGNEVRRQRGKHRILYSGLDHTF